MSKDKESEEELAKGVEAQRGAVALEKIATNLGSPHSFQLKPVLPDDLIATTDYGGPLTIPVIASGGVGSIADIDNLLAANEPNIGGVVVGRALYDGRIDVAAALAMAG